MSSDDLESRMARIMRRLGFGDCASVVYSSLLFRYDPSSLEELCEATGYSPTATSLALAELESNNLVFRKKLGRKYVYTASDDFIQKFERFTEELLERELRPFRHALEQRINSIRDSAKERAQKLLSKANEAEKKLLRHVSRKTSTDGRKQ